MFVRSIGTYRLCGVGEGREMRAVGAAVQDNRWGGGGMSLLLVESG